MSQQKVLEVLKDGQFHSNVELCQGAGWRFGGSIHQLKQKGYIFTKEKHEGDKGYIEYWKLVSEPLEIITVGKKEIVGKWIAFEQETWTQSIIRKIKSLFI